MRTIEYHDTTLRVRYAETDQMGVVYHSNYLVWFEVGRVEFMRAMGYDYKSMETEDDCHIVVVEAHCRYEKPARYDQVLKVRTRVEQWRNRVVKFNYEIFLDENSCLLATGYTTHVVCGRDGRPKSLPAKYRDAPLKLYLTGLDRSNA
jgi:acyl-CoA thioester hydrolase